MDYRTEQLILHFVTEEDLTEVARAWWSDHRPVSEEEAKGAIAYMRGNYEKNAKGRLVHLCLAVCRAEDPGTIIGWCGLDGSRNQTEPEIFILLDEEYRNQGYGTQCVRELLRIAAEDYSLRGVHGGCFKDNIASQNGRCHPSRERLAFRIIYNLHVRTLAKTIGDYSLGEHHLTQSETDLCQPDVLG